MGLRVLQEEGEKRAIGNETGRERGRGGGTIISGLTSYSVGSTNVGGLDILMQKIDPPRNQCNILPCLCVPRYALRIRK